jgi:hypothetical protein
MPIGDLKLTAPDKNFNAEKNVTTQLATKKAAARNLLSCGIMLLMSLLFDYDHPAMREAA